MECKTHRLMTQRLCQLRPTDNFQIGLILIRTIYTFRLCVRNLLRCLEKISRKKEVTEGCRKLDMRTFMLNATLSNTLLVHHIKEDKVTGHTTKR
jgi:hypothetical protein